MRRGVAGHSVDDFYYLARSCLVKDESLFDRFDKIFAAHFNGIEDTFEALLAEVPEEWLRRQAELVLTDEERAEIEAMGGFDELMEALRERLDDDKYKSVKIDILFGDAGHEIANLAERRGAELVVLPSHGRTGFKRLLVGSVAERVVRLARCPVLILRS